MTGVFNEMRVSLRTKLFSLLAVMAISILAPRGGGACSVPVFRYALERWPADFFEVVVFHDGELDEESQRIVDWLAEPVEEGPAPGNYEVRLVDTATTMTERDTAIWGAQEGAQAPWLVAMYPYYSRAQGFVWSGPLDVSAAKRLVDSPMRREVAKRLLDGETAIWVLVEGSDKEANDAAQKMLDDHLELLEEELELPYISEQDYGYLSGGEEAADSLRIDFSTIRISRDNEEEAAFLNMLMKSEPDLLSDEYTTAPMAFPIYGRGRALFALVGPGVNEENVTDACVFLTGACSCQVKELNPGTDLLMSVNWGVYFDPYWMGEDGPEISALAELKDLEERKVAEEIAAITEEVAAETGSNLKRNIILVFIAQIILIAVVAVAMLRRRESS